MYDYVIVGGGSAGCVLAARLSEDADVTVCLLEAGPPDTHPLIHVPMGLLWMMRSKVLNWRFHTQPEPNLDGRRLFWPRGRTLGGSGSSNAMLYTRGHPSDYDAWAALGNRGWSFDEVLPHFRRAENHEAGADAFHGVGGPMNVATQRSPNILTRTFVEAGVQAGLPHNPDFNGREQDGVGLYEVTQRNGRRWSQARGYLGPAMVRPNLTVVTRAHATRILFEGDRAVGIAYVRKGRSEQAQARREVLLSAGAIQSPQLLMLSGIGDAAQLEAKGIALRKHLPGVGRNLQDHLDVLIVHTCRKAVSAGFTLRNFARAGFEFVRYLAQGKGILTIVGAEGGGFARSSLDAPIPDLQFHFNPLRLSNHGLDLKFLFGDGYSLHVCNLRPRSRGEIRLASADPMAQPEILANYLSDPEGEDLRRMIEGVKLARRVLAAPAFDPYRGVELRPEPPCDSDEDLRAFVRRHAGTIYHPVGTCRMGSDPMAVVDAQLRVHGVQGLRVVDASVMPLLVGGNTNAPTVMIAEKASEMIKGGRVPGPGEATPAIEAQPARAGLSAEPVHAAADR